MELLENGHRCRQTMSVHVCQPERRDMSAVAVRQPELECPADSEHGAVTVVGQARSAARGLHGPARGAVYISLKKPCPHIESLA